MAKYVFEVTIEPAPDMGMDSPESVLDLLDEIIRDSGIDNGASVRTRLVLVEQEEQERVAELHDPCGECGAVYSSMCHTCNPF